MNPSELLRFYVKGMREIRFNPFWKNGTGYYDHAVKGDHAPKLSLGETVWFYEPDPVYRYGLIHATRFGNVVLFERFTDDSQWIIVSNSPSILQTTGLMKNGALSYDEVAGIIETINLNDRIEKLFSYSEKSE